MCKPTDFFIQSRQDTIHGLEYRDVCPESTPNGTQLETDIAAADHNHGFRDRRVGEGGGAVTNQITIKLDTFHHCRLAAGGDDDVFGGNLLLAVLAFHHQLART